MTRRIPRNVVESVYSVARKALEEAVFHHLLCTAEAFFSGLENQVQRAGERSCFGQVLGCCQQRGSMPVVAACVHDAFVPAGMGQARRFVDGKRVHIGAQSQRRPMPVP